MENNFNIKQLKSIHAGCAMPLIFVLPCWNLDIDLAFFVVYMVECVLQHYYGFVFVAQYSDFDVTARVIVFKFVYCLSCICIII